MKEKNNQIFRLKKVLLNDKTLPTGLMSVLRSDLLEVYSSYFELSDEDFVIDLQLLPSGSYTMKTSVDFERIKKINFIE